MQANRAHTQTHKHAHTRAHTHAHIRHARTHTRTHPRAHTTRARARTHGPCGQTSHVRAHTPPAMMPLKANLARARTHTHTRARTHTPTRAHHTQWCWRDRRQFKYLQRPQNRERRCYLPRSGSCVYVRAVCEYVHAHVLKCVHAWVGRWLAQGWHCTVSLVVVDKLQCETGQIFLKYQILRYINTHTTHFNTHMPALANNTCHQATLLQRRVPVRHQNQFLLLWRVVVVAALLDLRPEATHLPS